MINLTCLRDFPRSIRVENLNVPFTLEVPDATRCVIRLLALSRVKVLETRVDVLETEGITITSDANPSVFE